MDAEDERAVSETSDEQDDSNSSTEEIVDFGLPSSSPDSNVSIPMEDNLQAIFFSSDEAEQDEVDRIEVQPMSPESTEREVQNYNLELPLEHRYFGFLVEAVNSDYILFPDTARLESFPLIFIHQVVIVPGQTVPVIIDSPSGINFIRNLIDSSSCRVIGVGFELTLGITAIIRDIGFDRTTNPPLLKMKLQGLQRFHIERYQRDRDSNFKADIVIQPDDEPATFISKLKSHGPHTLGAKHAFLSTGLPVALMNQFDTRYLVNNITRLLKRDAPQDFEFPSTPMALSHFALLSLPFPKPVKLTLLYKHNAIERLRLMCLTLASSYRYVCSTCRQFLASSNDKIILAKTGYSTCFVNPGGNIYELFTYKSLSNFIKVTPYSGDFSWFPEYEWTILSCTTCRQHLGWKFKTKRNNLLPKQFFGLTQQSHSLEFENANDGAMLKNMAELGSRSSDMSYFTN